VGAEPADDLLLDHLEKLALQRRRDVTDLVEEQGAAVGRLEQAGAGGLGVGEGALLVAEELGLDERLRQRGAVHFDEGAVAPAPGGVEGAGDVSLAAAGL